jgi:hypothetical protein
MLNQNYAATTPEISERVNLEDYDDFDKRMILDCYDLCYPIEEISIYLEYIQNTTQKKHKAITVSEGIFRIVLDETPPPNSIEYFEEFDAPTHLHDEESHMEIIAPIANDRPMHRAEISESELLELARQKIIELDAETPEPTEFQKKYVKGFEDFDAPKLVEIERDYTSDYFFQNEPNLDDVPEPHDFHSGIDWKNALKNHVLEFNKEYAIVLNSTKTLVMKATPNEDGRLERVYLSLDAFRNLYLNELIKTGEKENKKTGEITDIFDTKANAWLRHYDCVKYKDGVIFEPSRYANGIEVKKQIYGNKLNLWQGYSVEPKQGELGALDRIYFHIKHVICNDDDDCTEYLLNWIARCLQYPEKTGQTAVVMKGIEGCGKGTLARFIKDIFGQHGLHITNSKHLVGHFNGHLADCCFLFADEAFFAGNKEHENIQKGLITEPSLMVERKGMDAVSMQNRLKIVMASNNEWVAPTTKDGRRYFVLDVSSNYAKKKEYFAPLNKDINNPAIQAAFLFDMLHRDISDFDVSKIPDTKALQSQRAQSLDSFGRYWRDVLARGYIYYSEYGLHELQAWISEPATNLIQAGYEQWCDKKRIGEHNRIKDNSAIGKRLSAWYAKKRAAGTGSIIGETKDGKISTSSTRVNCYRLGTQTEAVTAFCENEKLDIDDLLSVIE